MYHIISGLVGVLGSFVPELLKLWKLWMDQRHELRMRKIDIKAAEFDTLHRRDELDNYNPQEIALLKEHESFGVQLLDAGLDRGLSQYLIGPLFYLFALLDALNSSVRPVIAYLAFGSYIAYRFFNWSGWGDEDWDVLFLILGFFFGNRVAKQTLGGSANTSYRS